MQWFSHWTKSYEFTLYFCCKSIPVTVFTFQGPGKANVISLPNKELLIFSILFIISKVLFKEKLDIITVDVSFRRVVDVICCI